MAIPRESNTTVAEKQALLAPLTTLPDIVDVCLYHHSVIVLVTDLPVWGIAHATAHHSIIQLLSDMLHNVRLLLRADMNFNHNLTPFT